jgi:hypothetical protein
MNNLRKTILNVLREQKYHKYMEKGGYKFAEGGYLVPCELNESNIVLEDDEFSKIYDLNENIKEMYFLHKQKLELLEKHNKGVLKKAIEKIRS